MASTASRADSGHVQAEEIDDIVQGLAVAKYALEAGDEPAAVQAIDAALAKARALLARERGTDLLRSRPTR